MGIEKQTETKCNKERAKELMTEWRTVNLPKEFKEEISEYAEENGFGSAKEFLIFAARKEIEKENTKQIVRKILKEENLI